MRANLKVNIAEAAASAQSGDFRSSSPSQGLGDSPAWTKPVPSREPGQSHVQSLAPSAAGTEAVLRGCATSPPARRETL